MLAKSPIQRPFQPPADDRLAVRRGLRHRRIFDRPLPREEHLFPPADSPMTGPPAAALQTSSLHQEARGRAIPPPRGSNAHGYGSTGFVVWLAREKTSVSISPSV
jgi:hypothetical protein